MLHHLNFFRAISNSTLLQNLGFRRSRELAAQYLEYQIWRVAGGRMIVEKCREELVWETCLEAAYYNTFTSRYYWQSFQDPSVVPPPAVAAGLLGCDGRCQVLHVAFNRLCWAPRRILEPRTSIDIAPPPTYS